MKDILVVKPCHERPQRAIPFDKALKATDYRQWIHFYTDDRRFECVWNNPKAYLRRFKQFDGCLSADFSLYRDMLLSMQIWNTYRNRTLTFWMQSNQINVIPNVQWGDERSYDFCFDGIPKNAVVAISTNGCIQEKTDCIMIDIVCFFVLFEILLKRHQHCSISTMDKNIVILDMG